MTREGRLGIIVCLVALILGGTAGCGASEDAAPAVEGASPTIQEAPPAVEGVSLADVARMLPASPYSFSTTDLRQLREDSDLAGLYDALVELRRFWTVETATGLRASDIHWWTEAYGMDETITMCGAEFELAAVRDHLGVNGYQDEYGGVEVWRVEWWGNSFLSVAIMDSVIILGTADCVDQCVDTIGGGRSSLYDEPGVAEVLSGLSPGYSGSVTTRDPQCPGLQASASSWWKASRDSIEYQTIVAFEDDEYAQAFIDEMEEIYLYMPDQEKPADHHLERQGRFVEVLVEYDSAAPAGQPGGGAEAYQTDKEVMQQATASFFSDLHGGWDDVNDDGAAGYSDNVWGAEAADEGPEYYWPTAIALVWDHILTLSTTQFDPANPDNPRIEGASGAATDEEIAAHAIWMGLLVNRAGEYTSSVGTTDRELVSPLGGETGRYLQEFPESGMAGDDRNGVPAPGGSYCWVIGGDGMVYRGYGAYEGGDGYWYAGFSGAYP